MKLGNQTRNRQLNLGTFCVSIAFIFTYILGSYACMDNTSNTYITESHIKNPNKVQKTDTTVKVVYWNDPNCVNDPPVEELYGSPGFDETQYASDHWDEYLEDPENIDDFPENIFDAQHD